MMAKSRDRTTPKCERHTRDEAPDAVRSALVEGPKDRDTTVIVTPTRFKTDLDFLFLFAANLCQVLDYAEVNMTDLRVLFKYAEMASWGCAISIDQRDVAEALNIHPPRVSRSVKKLVDAGLIIREGRSMWLNHAIFFKGRIGDAKDRYQDQVELSLQAMHDLYGDCIKNPHLRVKTSSDRDET